jgi:hypothetical protein
VAELGLAVAVSLVNPIVPSPTMVSPTLSFVDFGNGFGIGKSGLPMPTSDVSRFKLITPLGDIPLLPLTVPVRNRTAVNFYYPVTSVWVGPGAGYIDHYLPLVVDGKCPQPKGS